MEPRLANEIEGRVSGSIKPLEGVEEDFEINLAAAGAQLWQVARGKEPLKLNNEEMIAQLQQDMGVWFQKMTEDAGKNEAVFLVDFTGPQTAYGEVATQA
jgi:hypothetical protein